MTTYDMETMPGRDMAGEHKLDIPIYILATLFTCGLFNLYWNYRQMRACNDLLGRREFSWFLWILLSLCTCGIYHFYYQYQMGSAILEVQRARGTQLFDNLPLVGVILTLFGLSFAVDIIHQGEINKLVDPQGHAS
jgi:hypothetical protein